MLLLPLFPLIALTLPAQQPMNINTLRTALSASKPSASLAEPLRKWFGAENLKRGALKTDELKVAFAIELAEGETEPKLVSDDGAWSLPLKPINGSTIWAATAELPEGFGTRWKFEVGGKARGGGELEVYTNPPESKKQPGVPEGKLTQNPMLPGVAAVSVGLVDGKALLDLAYVEDAAAEVDLNLVANEAGEFVEIQGSGEESTFSEGELTSMLSLGKLGIQKLFSLQNQAVA